MTRPVDNTHMLERKEWALTVVPKYMNNKSLEKHNSQTDQKATIPLKFQQQSMNPFLKFKGEHDLSQKEKER